MRNVFAFLKGKGFQRKEALLQEKEVYWREIFEAQTEGLCVFDLDGRLYDFNDAYAQLVGYSREELLQKGWLELTVEEYLEEDQKRLPEIMAGKTVRFEKAYVHKDGHHVPILISYRLLHRQKDWEKDRLLATCVDITAEKAIGEKLREERAFWGAVFNGAPSSMFLMNMDGRLADANEACAREHGYSPEELRAVINQGVNAIQLFVPPRRHEKIKNLLADVAEGKLAVYEFEDIRKDGTPFPVLCMNRKIERAGKPLYLIAQVSLSEIKQKEAELQATLHRLRDSGQLLESFAEELFSSQQALSQRIEKEASSLEEISASMEEITATSQAVADQGTHTLEAASAVDGAAQGISAKMTSLKSQMDELSEAAQDTTEIIAAIGKIASQTQILSLNASIEAAKAKGDASRGFAVIAHEIHNLANRTESNVKDTEKWFKKLGAQIQQNLASVNETLLKLDDITSQISRVREMMGQVTAAIEENQSSSRQIQDSVNELEQGVHHLSSMGDEVSRIGWRIRDEAHGLVMVSLHSDSDLPGPAKEAITSALGSAISSHHAWRSRLLETAYGHQAPIGPLQAGDSSRCDLGRFLGEHAGIRRLPQYNEILRLHTAFHEEAGRIAQIILEGRQKEAQHELLLGDSAYNRRSQSLVRLLEEALRESASGNDIPRGASYG